MWDSLTAHTSRNTTMEWGFWEKKSNTVGHGSIHDELFWVAKSVLGYALETAALTLNRVPSKSVEKTPYELWHGRVPNISFLKIWGCEAFVKRMTSELLRPKLIVLRTWNAWFYVACLIVLRTCVFRNKNF